MHAKMTRDRKKCFLASLNRVIAKLEEENQGLRDVLSRSREEESLDEQKPAAIANYSHGDFHLQQTEKELEPTAKNKSVPPTLQESSAALMSISNSRIFTVG